MKILLLISEVWNDRIHPNNNMSNWLEGMADAEIATIYTSPGRPENNCCSRYFQLTEAGMVKSLLGGRVAGHSFTIDPTETFESKITESNSSIYGFFRSISNEFVRLIRDVIWKTGRINLMELEQFIKVFNPDVIFTQRMGSVKMCRIERIVSKLTDAPMVAYTGDDEYSLKQYNLSPIYWLRRFWVRHELKKNIPLYRIFYSQSEDQMKEFQEEFGSDTKFLVKCGIFEKEKVHTSVNEPIVMTYAGKLYCNRWKTLTILAECIRQINCNKPIFVLKIYTRDKITSKQNELLNDGTNSIIMGGVNAEELKRVYTESDILLHVESFDKKNRLLTKYSFSTKIMECLSSGCAVMAIGANNQAGCYYLKKQDAAFVASSKEDILKILYSIVENRQLVTAYAEKAYDCGVRNHQRANIQAMLIADFNSLIDKNSKD